MTQKEAYKKLLKRFPDKVASRCVLYKDSYVFLLVPKENPQARVLDSFYTVDKDSGEIGAYQPTNDNNSKEFFKLWNSNAPKPRRPVGLGIKQGGDES